MSNPFDPIPAIHEEILALVAERIEALNLDEEPGVYQQSVTDDQTQDVIAFPAILVSPFGVENLAPNGGTNERDDIGYPVVIAIVAAGNVDQTEGRNQRLRWREQIVAALHHKPVTIGRVGSNCYDITIEPSEIVALPAWMGKMKAASFLTARVWCRVKQGVA